MRLTTPIAAAAALAAALLAAACSPLSNQGSGASGNALSGMSSTQIINKALTDLAAAPSVTMSGSLSQSGQDITLDLMLLRGQGCQGKLSLPKQGSFQMIFMGQNLWIQPDNQFWQSAGGLDSGTLALVSGKYLTLSAGSSLSDFKQLCDVRTVTDGVQGTTGLAKGATTTIDGQHVLQLTDRKDNQSAYVTISAKPELVRLTDQTSHLDFTGYGQPVTLTPPPASQTVDGSQYGF
jgi:hypothetical protein